MFIGPLENSSIFLGTYKVICICSIVWTCLGKIQKGHISSEPLANLEALKKQELKTKGGLSTAWLSVEGMLQHSHRIFGKDWETYWFWALKKKKISAQSQADH